MSRPAWPKNASFRLQRVASLPQEPTLEERLGRALREDFDEAELLIAEAIRQGHLGQISEQRLKSLAERPALSLPARQGLLEHLRWRLPTEDLQAASFLHASTQPMPTPLRAAVEHCAPSRRWALEMASSWGFRPQELSGTLATSPLTALQNSPEFGSQLAPPGSTPEDLQRWKDHLRLPGLVPHHFITGERLPRIRFRVLALQAPSPTRFTSKAYVRALLEEVGGFFRRELGPAFASTLQTFRQQPDRLPLRRIENEIWVDSVLEFLPKLFARKADVGQVRVLLMDESDHLPLTYGLSIPGTIVVRLGAWSHGHALVIAHELGHQLLGLQDNAVAHPLEHGYSLMGYDWKGTLSCTSLGYRYRAACLRSPEVLQSLAQARACQKEGQARLAADRASEMWRHDRSFLAAGLLAVEAWNNLRKPRKALAIARQVIAAFPSEVVSFRLQGLLGRRYRCPLSKTTDGSVTKIDRERRMLILGHSGLPRKFRELSTPVQLRKNRCLETLSFSLLNAGQLEAAYKYALLRADIGPFNYASWSHLLQISVFTGRVDYVDQLYRICRTWKGQAWQVRALWLLARERWFELLELLLSPGLLHGQSWWCGFAARLLIRSRRIDEARALVKGYPRHLPSHSYEARWLGGEPLRSLRETLIRRRTSFLDRLEALEWLAFLDPTGPWVGQLRKRAPGWPVALAPRVIEPRPAAPVPWHPKSPGLWPRFELRNRPVVPRQPSVLVQLGSTLYCDAARLSFQRAYQQVFQVLHDHLGQPQLTFSLSWLEESPPFEYRIVAPWGDSLSWRLKSRYLVVGPEDGLKSLELPIDQEPAGGLPCVWSPTLSEDQAADLGLTRLLAREVLYLHLAWLCSRPSSKSWIELRDLLHLPAME